MCVVICIYIQARQVYMCVGIYYVYAHQVYNIRNYIWTCGVYVCVYVCIYVYTFVRHVHVCVCMFTYMHAESRMYVHVYLYTH